MPTHVALRDAMALSMVVLPQSASAWASPSDPLLGMEWPVTVSTSAPASTCAAPLSDAGLELCDGMSTVLEGDGTVSVAQSGVSASRPQEQGSAVLPFSSHH